MKEENCSASSELVSVIMPAYNAEEYIAESIECVLNQSYPCLELIVVDDGSRDNTRKVVESYQAKDPRVLYVYQTNAGPGQARNRALSLAKGKYISNLDSDDLWPIDKLEIQMNILKKDDNKIILGDVKRFSKNSDGSIEWGKSTHLEPVSKKRLDYTLQTLGVSSYQMVHFNTFCGQTKFFKEVGGWDSSIRSAEDYDIWLRLSSIVEFVHLKKILQFYRKHASSYTAESSYSLSLNAQLDVIDKCVASVGLSWLVKRRVKIRPYTEVIKHQIHVHRYATALKVYVEAATHSNIFITYSGIKLLLITLRALATRRMDKHK